MSEENKALACRFIEEVLNEGNPATIDELINPDWIDQVDPVSLEEARSLEGAGNSSRCTAAPSLCPQP